MFVYTLIASSVLAAVNSANYPPPFAIPATNPQWTKAYLDGVDVPLIQPGKEALPFSNWTKDITTCPDPSDWAITIDDGTSVFTRNITEEMRIANMKATFFIVGSQILTFDAELRALADAGHQLGIHTWSHRPLTTLTNDEIVVEIAWTAKIINEVTGLTPKYVRSPNGDIDDRVRAIIKAMGMTHVAWNHDDEDWRRPMQDVLVDLKNMVSGPRNETGPVTLHHDIYKDSAATLVPSIHMAAASGFKLKTVGDCVGDKNVYDNSILEKIKNIPSVGTVGVKATGGPASATPVRASIPTQDSAVVASSAMAVGATLSTLFPLFLI